MFKLGYIKLRIYNDYLMSKIITSKYKTNYPQIDRQLMNYYIYFSHSHFDENYEERRLKRIDKILQIYPIEYFNNKKILVLGDGLGDVGEFFAELGANVLSVEGRLININIAKLKFRESKTNHKYIQVDLNKDFTHLGKFDIIINWGLVEIIKDFKNMFDCCCKMSNTIWVETIVFNGNGIKTINKGGGGVLNDWEMTNTTHLVSTEVLEECFENNGFQIQRYFDKDLNCRLGTYDWKKGDKIKNEFARFWIFKK